MSTNDVMPQVDGLHDLAERLEQTGIECTVSVNVHPTDDADGERLADALGLTDRHDFAAGDHRAFTTWQGTYDGVAVTVYGTTPKEGQA